LRFDGRGSYEFKKLQLDDYPKEWIHNCQLQWNQSINVMQLNLLECLQRFNFNFSRLLLWHICQFI
jgi:hypothetical protein